MPLCHLHRGVAGIVFQGVTRVTTGLIYLSAYSQSLGKTTTSTTSITTAQNGATTQASASAVNVKDNNDDNGNHNSSWHPQKYREILSCQLSTSPRSLAVSPDVSYCRAPVIPVATSSTSTSTSTSASASKPTWWRFWGRRRSVSENPNNNNNNNNNAEMR